MYTAVKGNMLGDALALFSFIEKKVEENRIIQAHFGWDGTRISGSEWIKITVSCIPRQNKIWFYHIQPYGGYIFIPFPVNPEVNVDYGTAVDDTNPSVEFFRYVSSPMARFTLGTEENLKVDFFVFGYLPTDLMTIKKV